MNAYKLCHLLKKKKIIVLAPTPLITCKNMLECLDLKGCDRDLEKVGIVASLNLHLTFSR